MPPGCLRARMPSASSPSSGSGAWRYSSSASPALIRSPARTLSAIDDVIFNKIHRRGSKELDVPPRLDQPMFRGQLVEAPQALRLAVAKPVLDILPQVPTAEFGFGFAAVSRRDAV